MATIVNADDLPSLEARQADLWAHKSFGSLYEYNPIISDLKELRAPVQKVIGESIKYWNDIAATYDLSSDLPSSTAPGMPVDAKFEFPIYGYKFTTSDGTEYTSVSSLIEVDDPFNTSLEDPDTFWNTFRKYTRLRLFPLVAFPAQYNEILGIAEKFEFFHPVNYTGTIIDFIKQDNHVYALVLWSMDTIKIYRDRVFGSMSGVLYVENALETPQIWRDSVTDFEHPLSVPIFAHHPNFICMGRILRSTRLQNDINIMILQGQYMPDYVEHLIAKLKESTDVIAALQAAGSEPNTAVVPNTPAMEPDEAPEPVPVQDSGVEVEDASMDEWARRMRLADEVIPDSDYSGSITEDLLKDYRYGDIEIG